MSSRPGSRGSLRRPDSSTASRPRPASSTSTAASRTSVRGRAPAVIRPRAVAPGVAQEVGRIRSESTTGGSSSCDGARSLEGLIPRRRTRTESSSGRLYTFYSRGDSPNRQDAAIIMRGRGRGGRRHNSALTP